jgi:peptidoglycan/xylan/chitin deacetylase (PgdA/CDA1 family)
MTFVGEWHHIAVGKTTMHRSPTEFRSDLERLYKAGFRPVTAHDWLAGKMDLAKGASPVVMTFDDANPDQFKLLDDGSVDPNCGVGIWLDFAKTHPDFPVKGTFYVLPTMWGQPKWVSKKLEMLHGWGSEIGNHTITHVPLRHQTDERVKQEVGDAALALEKLGEKGPFSLAYPLGSTPKNLAMLKEFDWKGQKIVTTAGFLVGANPSPDPSSPKFDPYRIPRIQATKGVCGLDYWFDELKKGHVKLYVE